MSKKVPNIEILVADEDGNIVSVSARKIIQHENWIIEDNIAYGLFHPSCYSEEDIKDYEREARQTLAELKTSIKDHPYSLYGYQRRTETLKEIIVNEEFVPRKYSKEEAKKAMAEINKWERL